MPERKVSGGSRRSWAATSASSSIPRLAEPTIQAPSNATIASGSDVGRQREPGVATAAGSQTHNFQGPGVCWSSGRLQQRSSFAAPVTSDRLAYGVFLRVRLWTHDQTCVILRSPTYTLTRGSHSGPVLRWPHRVAKCCSHDAVATGGGHAQGRSAWSPWTKPTMGQQHIPGPAWTHPAPPRPDKGQSGGTNSQWSKRHPRRNFWLRTVFSAGHALSFCLLVARRLNRDLRGVSDSLCNSESQDSTRNEQAVLRSERKLRNHS